MIGDRLLRALHHTLIVVIVVGSTLVLSAQTVVDPRFVEFEPSPDHDQTASDGTPLVQRYSLAVFVVGSSVAFDTMDLGKPAPNTSGIIRVDFLPLLHVVPTPGIVFEARVSAVGPGGSTASTVSNGFSFSPTCAPAISPTGQSVGSAGGTGSVGVTAGTGCTWSAVSNAAWITLTGATSGSGNGSVPYSVAANGTTSQRIGTLTVAGRTYTVTQVPLSCSYSLSPTGQSVAAGGGTGSTNVTAPTGCSWTGVSSNTSWLTVTSGASGSGNGSVSFSTTANPNGTQRVGTLTIGGQTFTVTQAAAPCTFSIAPTGQSVTSSGGTGSTNVTAPTGCTWTGVSNSTPWLTVTSGANGSGNGSVGFNATANPNGTQRVGTLTIAGQTFTVTQAAAPCTIALAPTGQAVAAGGGTGSTNVTAPTGCAWTAASNNAPWLTVTSGANGSGNGSVGFSVAGNPNGTQRVGTLTIGGETFTVTQAPTSCGVALAPTGQSFFAGGGTGATNVTAPTGCAWTATSNNTPWLTVTSGASGSGNGSVSFNATANPNGTQRVGTLTVGGEIFTVTQAPVPCTFSIAPTGQSVVAAGGTGSTSVTAPTGCSWTGVSNDTPWLTVTSGASGSGNGSVSFNAAANPNGAQRVGTLTIGGQTFTVTQAAVACTFSIAPTAQSVAATGATGSTNVTTQTGCPWSAQSNASWITLTSGTSGTGNGTVSFSVSASSSTSQRVGTLTIAAQTFTVTQAGATTTCSVSLSPTSQSVSRSGGSGSTNVTVPAGCSWTAWSNNIGWLSVSVGGGSGTGVVGFNAIVNLGPARTGTLTIGGQTFTVNQSGACSFSISPTSQTVAPSGGNGSTTVTAGAGCPWTAVSNAAWITVIAGATGSGNGTASFSVAANTGAPQRSGTLTIAGRTFTVSQGAASSRAPVAPRNPRIVAVGGTGGN